MHIDRLLLLNHSRLIMDCRCSFQALVYTSKKREVAVFVCYYLMSQLWYEPETREVLHFYILHLSCEFHTYAVAKAITCWSVKWEAVCSSDYWNVEAPQAKLLLCIKIFFVFSEVSQDFTANRKLILSWKDLVLGHRHQSCYVFCPHPSLSQDWQKCVKCLATLPCGKQCPLLW